MGVLEGDRPHLAALRHPQSAPPLSPRRRFLHVAFAAVIATAPVACAENGRDAAGPRDVDPTIAAEAAKGRISARPHGAARGKPRYGVSELGIVEERDALLYVPPGYRPGRPAPLVLTLHGANGGAKRSISPLLPRADDAGIILVGAASRSNTWDFDFGTDVEVINAALEKVFSTYSVDPDHVAVEGYSDGASYALSLGITNGDLFGHVMAFSPGFMSPGEPRGKPRIFISHGTEDPVLPIEQTSGEIVPDLRAQGYEVRFIEFPGGHRPWPAATDEAVRWFLRA